MLIAIIGGGASGMAAALAAAEHPGAQVVLLERQARLGRKLQATGNGRCNLTNLHALEGGYHGDSPAFCEYALNCFPPEETLQWFRNMGLYTVAEESGRVYPYSDQANSVVDVLRFALEKPNIRVELGLSAAAQPGASLHPSAPQSGAGENQLGGCGVPQGRAGKLPRTDSSQWGAGAPVGGGAAIYRVRPFRPCDV